EVSALFGAEEEQLATLIAALAGAALEHVAGSEAYFRKLIENAHDITAVINEDAVLTYVSPSSLKVLGYDPEQMVGSSPSDLLHPDDLPILAESFSRISNE